MTESERCAEVVRIHEGTEAPPPMGCDLLRSVIAKQAANGASHNRIEDALDDIRRRHDAHDQAHKHIEAAIVRLDANVSITNQSVIDLRELVMALFKTAPTMPAPAISTAAEPSTATVETR